MRINTSRQNLGEISEDLLIVPVFEGESVREGALAALDHLTGGAIAPLFESGEVDGKRDRSTLLYDAGTLAVKRLLLYGAGAAESLSPLVWQRVAGAAIRSIGQRKITSAAFLLRAQIEDEAQVRAIVEGALLGEKTSDLYRSKRDPVTRLETLHLVSESPDAPDFAEAARVAQIVAEAANFARDLGNEPGNVITPSELADRAVEMARREGLAVEVLGEEEMKQLGMGALLAVSRGSEQPARLIFMTYEPQEAGSDYDGPVIALIGKGITFDSGGISIKPAEHMEEMKYDMGGGAAVIGALQAIARLRPNVRVLGVVPASENLPSGRAVKPGDVVRSLSGKTIEVINTDAEGRLILADAMTYAINHGATHLVDAATLTGACVVALGDVRAAVIGTDQPLIDALLSAGEQCGERLWQLPADKEYGELIRSDIADMKNIGNRTAGAITAAMFLKHFAGDLPWAHLDIAGTAWLTSTKPYMAKGATGFGVRLLTRFVLGFNREDS